MTQDGAKGPEACWRQVLRLLQRRQHSRRELVLKLRQRGYARTVAEAAVAEAERLHLVDDAAFAADYREELQRKGMGEHKVRAALRRRGVTANAEPVANSANREQDLAGERERARAALARKCAALVREPDPRKRREKLMRFLLGRGFAHDLVRDLVGEEE